jgi:26S proteasome regulatory subunit N3
MRCARSVVSEKHKAVFDADKTHNLIVRLRHNVIRAGLRRINLAYSRIALKDVAQKLGKPLPLHSHSES